MNSVGNSNVPLGGAGRLRAAANASVNQPQGQFTSSLVSGVRYSIGSSGGDSGKDIRLEDSEKRVTHLFARVIDPNDINVGDIDNVLKNILLQQGCEDECSYVPLKLNVVEGSQTKQQVFLVRVKDVRESLEAFANVPNVRQSSVLAPSSVVEFLDKHGASDDDVDAAVSALHQGQSFGRKRKAADQVVAGSPSESIISREWFFDRLSDAALFYTIKALKLNDQQVNDIGFIARNYKRSQEYLEFAERQKNNPGIDAFYAYHIRAGTDVTIDGRIYATPLSLLVNPTAPEGTLDVEVLLKGKIPDYLLRAKGALKSIKTTMDLATGRIRVQCTLNVSQEAMDRLNYREANGGLCEERNLTPEAVANLRDMENQLIRGYMEEVDLQLEFSGIKTEKTGAYAASATRDSQIAVRARERKYIRKGGELLLTYTMEEAQGDLANTTLSKTKVLRNTNVQEISQSFYDCLLDTAVTIEKLHAKNRVHRDLKPGNLLLFSEKNEDRVKVGDYGLSMEVNADGTAKEGRGVAGVIVCMDPDIIAARFLLMSLHAGIFVGDNFVRNKALEAERRKNLDFKKGDVYGLGCTYYAILMDNGSIGSKALFTPFGVEVLKVNQEISRAQTKKNQNTIVKEDVEAISKRIDELRNLAKTLPLMEAARNNLMKVCPPQVADLIASMLHPDAKVRPDMAQVVAAIKGLQGLVR